MTAPTPERRVGERVELGELVTAAEYAERDPFVVPMSRAVYATLLHHEFESVRLTAEVERLRQSDLQWHRSFAGHVYVKNEEYAALCESQRANASLTAEVERLTKEKAEAVAEVERMRRSMTIGAAFLTDDVEFSRAALSLPTPAPEATE